MPETPVPTPHSMPALRPDCHAAPLDALLNETMPAGTHFQRTHFGVPIISRADYRLEVSGLVTRPTTLTFDDLTALGAASDHITLECAGHRRTEFQPVPAGVPWALGAVSHAGWSGARLSDLIAQVKPLPEATHLVMYGADQGAVEGRAKPEAFARALPLNDPVIADSMLAWEMNGVPLEATHGAPVRAVVPGWYAVSSIKWLVKIEFIAGAFDGFFQAVDYRLLEPGETGPGRELTVMFVHSLVTRPTTGHGAPAGAVEIAGIAWGGRNGISTVEVQVDDGAWQTAQLQRSQHRHAPTKFSLLVQLSPGDHQVRSRATDGAGDCQPAKSNWNSRGYGINGVRAVTVTIEAAQNN